MIAFGPVPSRRLGRSLGINNIPPKLCTYSCVYCQLGRTLDMVAERRRFYGPEAILRDVTRKLEDARAAGEPVDYLTFVPDGEPTLDRDLEREIDALKVFGIDIAVIANGSLIWREDVRSALTKADWVSVKVDAAHEDIWRRVDRPHGALHLADIHAGLIAFARGFTGFLATETMLVEGVNDSEEQLAEVAELLAQVKPGATYLSIPIRPPAEAWARPPTEDVLNRAYHILSAATDWVEYLIGYEGNEFAFTGDVEQDLLAITAVHPMRDDAVEQVLAQAGATWQVVGDLLARGSLAETEYAGHGFYLRRWARTSPRGQAEDGEAPEGVDTPVTGE